MYIILQIIYNVGNKRVEQTSKLDTPAPFHSLSSTNHHGSTKYCLIALQRSKYPSCYLSYLEEAN
jgi:hypothetical protein